MKNVIYVESAKGKPISLSCPVAPGENHYLSISQYMIDNGIPHEVPDNDFYHGKISEGLLVTSKIKNASEVWGNYIKEKTKADNAREKTKSEARTQKLLKLKEENDKRYNPDGKAKKPKVKKVEEPKKEPEVKEAEEVTE